MQPTSTSPPPSNPNSKKATASRGTKLWHDALIRAKAQAEAYVRSTPDDNPPFLLVLDVGYSIETDFSGLGKTYTPFPNNLPPLPPPKMLYLSHAIAHGPRLAVA